MISGVKGKLEAIGGEWAIVGVNGVSFQVYAPTSTLSVLGGIGVEVKLYTHMHVRDDNISLYGFATPDELRLFEILLGVSGTGPKLALAMLSAMKVEDMTLAIATGNTDLLTEIPGVGKKTAQRLVLELKDKIGSGWAITSSAGMVAQENADVLAALTSLGYSVAEASRAVATLPPDQKLSMEEKVRIALQYFGGK
jgi:Holliday junction DNA helicase RuvA